MSIKKQKELLDLNAKVAIVFVLTIIAFLLLYLAFFR